MHRLSQVKSHKDFDAMLVKMDAARLELQNGRAAAFKALWSQADDITLSGGFGGTIEKGWGEARQASLRLGGRDNFPAARNFRSNGW